MRVRPMIDADYDRCHAIHARATMSSYGKVYPWLEPLVTDPLHRLESVEWTVVCERGAEVVGYAAVTARHLENLFVAPEAQGCGVGAALLDAVEARAGLPLSLRCLIANPRARAFYERYGFAVSHREHIEFFGQRLQTWLMRKA